MDAATERGWCVLKRLIAGRQRALNIGSRGRRIHGAAGHIIAEVEKGRAGLVRKQRHPHARFNINTEHHRSHIYMQGTSGCIHVVNNIEERRPTLAQGMCLCPGNTRGVVWQGSSSSDARSSGRAYIPMDSADNAAADSSTTCHRRDERCDTATYLTGRRKKFSSRVQIGPPVVESLQLGYGLVDNWTPGTF